MRSELRVTYTPDSDSAGEGELGVAVASRGFSGSGSTWTTQAEVVTFVEKGLSAYPLQPGQSVDFRGGYWGRDGELEEPLVQLSICPEGSVGELSVAVFVRAKSPPSTGGLVSPMVQTELRTSYEQLSQFLRTLEAVARGDALAAVLEGTPV